MQLYILDKDPEKSASLVPNKYKFKMLIELGQLISSVGLSKVYKTIPQGKELQAWVYIYRSYAYRYFNTLLAWSKENIKAEKETIDRLEQIKKDLFSKLYEISYSEPKHAYFRYSSKYNCLIKSKTLLPIDECISEYSKYLDWKLNDSKSKK